MSSKVPLLFLISGLPRTGKNRAGAILSNHFNGDHFALSDILKKETHKYYGLSADLSVFHFEDNKDVPNEAFDGLTPREAYINYSETIIKPKFGKSHLGELVLKRVMDNKNKQKPSIISGVGFIEEVLPLINCAGQEHTIHLIITRDDYQQPKQLVDSRQTLNLKIEGVAELTIGPADEVDFMAGVGRFIGKHFGTSLLFLDNKSN
ncbi:MAG: hypothetical protein OXC82_05775 [Rhodobacteraceae bacterium]|nr:hypothetical protein [Paracoccaceae bacterium]MCY4249930.1 hypothetical protein [Paracoccaceae bacterium]